jgi:flavin reductase (DIM6/NTAB) family NADH-FMN oxidoreductase RutF
MSTYSEYKGRFYYLLHPRLTIILATLCPNGRINLMPASWNTPVSEDPPTVGVAVDKESYTRECLEYSGEATINVPSSEQANLVYSLGTISGREVDKVKVYNVGFVDSKMVKVPGIDGSLAIMEGKVIDKLEIGDVVFYVFHVVRAIYRDSVADEYGYNFAAANVLLHGSGKVFYKVDPKKIWARKI